MKMRPDLYAAFLVRYPRSQYAFMEEVCEDVAGDGRRADAMVLNLWRSRGQELEGFEVKADRGDWLREMKDPSKAEALARYCDRWWVIAAGPDVVKADELPATWGLLELRGKKLVLVVGAQKLAPDPRPWRFVCSMVRRAQDVARHADEALKEQLKEEIRTQIAADASNPETIKAVARLERELEETRTLIRDFNEKAGVHLTDWSLGNIVEAVKLVRSVGEHEGAVARLRRVHGLLKDAERATSASLKAAIEDLERHRGAA